MVRALAALGSVAAIFFWRGYRAGNRRGRAIERMLEGSGIAVNESFLREVSK